MITPINKESLEREIIICGIISKLQIIDEQFIALTTNKSDLPQQSYEFRHGTILATIEQL